MDTYIPSVVVTVDNSINETLSLVREDVKSR